MQDMPFICYQKNNSPCYYVRFKTENGDYLPEKSTRQREQKQAIKIAWEWYKDGFTGSQQKRKTIKELTLQNELKNADDEILQFALNELKRRGKLKAVVYTGSKQDIKAKDYMLDFWTWEKSEYIKEKLRKSHTIGVRHTRKQLGNVKNYWCSFLKDKTLGEITRDDIKRFVDKVADMNKSFKTKNDIIRAGTKPLKYAFENELIERDITRGIVFFSGTYTERAILTPEIAQAIFSIKWRDERSRLANMLAMCTGMRAGEIQALRLQDLGQGCIYVKHNWDMHTGLKSTKNGEERTVQAPEKIINALKSLAEINPYNQGLEGFVFWSTVPFKPMEKKTWLNDLRDALKQWKVAEPEKYCFHSWRHYFSTYMIQSVECQALQKQTGHKTKAILEHYADHETERENNEIRKAQKMLFGSIVEKDTNFNFDSERLNNFIRVEYKNIDSK